MGGRLVMPVGTDPLCQRLIRLTRTSDITFEQEDLGEVTFVPLVGVQGWQTAAVRKGREQANSLPSEPIVEN